jgi:peptide/nickel transport system substrate-binding protein
MLEAAVTEDDGLRWRLMLRPGLRFHDNEPVLARDCVASIRRWGARDTFGQALMAATDVLSAPDDRTIVFRLRTPFPLLPDALAKTAPNPCVIMPERLAATDPFKQVSEMIGSGPYRFLADERIPGARVVYGRFDGYVLRETIAPSRTAGPKRAGFDRVEWTIIPDAATAGAALQRGEVDWWLAANPDLLGRLRADRRLVVRTQDPTGIIATMRFSRNTVHFVIRIAALKSMRVVGCGVRGRNG